MSVGLRNRRTDLIRGVSILLVLFHHFATVYRLDDTALARAFGWEAVHAVARNGNYGVTMFFVVSRFLITSNTRRRWGQLGRVGAKLLRSSRRAHPTLPLAAPTRCGWVGAGGLSDFPEPAAAGYCSRAGLFLAVPRCSPDVLDERPGRPRRVVQLSPGRSLVAFDRGSLLFRLPPCLPLLADGGAPSRVLGCIHRRGPGLALSPPS